MKRFLLPLALLIAMPALAATTNNDDSCDISWQPAATLLLPYFEVDFNSPPQLARQTIFSIQNVSSIPQIANVTLWTDWAYPAYSFPVFLTGYDVQPYNLYDLFAGSTVVNTTSDAPVPENPVFGTQPAPNSANPNFLNNALAACHNVPGAIPPSVIDELRRIFTFGKTATGCQVGGVHTDAIGYITIDVVATCAPKTPMSSDYYSILLYDNVLTGDYEQLVPRASKSYAQGAPLVHIRAIPEGGPPGVLAGTSLPYTFYDRYTPFQSPTIDRRQPLPSVFAPRYIEGGTGSFHTTFKIWREGVTSTDAGCTSYQSNAQMPQSQFVRFDEHENATLNNFFCVVLCPGPPPGPPPASALSSNNYLFPPPSTSGDIGGWFYLNLDNGGSKNYSVARPGYGQKGRPSQAWVITSMFAEPTYAIETHAIALGNGCTPRTNNNDQTPLGPAPNPTP
jgi:hypothetical protein